MQLNKKLGWIILLTASLPIFCIILLHILQPGLNPSVNAISEYVLGDCGWLMSITFIMLSIGSIALAVLAIKMKPRMKKTTIVGVLFLFAALGSAIAGLFPADPIHQETLTQSGKIHALGGFIRFVSLAIALPIFSSVIKRKERWHIEGSILRILSILFVICFIATMFILAPIKLFGLGQRIFILVSLLWMVVLCLPLIRTDNPKSNNMN